MALTQDIVRGWRHPRQVLRQHLRRGKSEPFAFSLLVTFLLLAFVSLWPSMSRLSVQHPEVPMVQRMLAAGLALLAMIPFFYLLAAISHWIARIRDGQGSHYGARMALFAALVTVSPAMLLQGLVAGMIGPGLQLDLVGILVIVGFLWIWLSMLIEAERGDAG
jgi:hypothetical protein